MRRWYANGDTKTMVEDQQKELDRWRDVKDMAARERWAEYWAAWAAQKSLDENKEKGKKRKRYDTKEEAEAAAGDNRDRDPDYVRSEEKQQYGSNLCTFQKGAQESQRGRRQINEITTNTCIFFQDCKVQLIPSFSISDVQQ